MLAKQPQQQARPELGRFGRPRPGALLALLHFRTWYTVAAKIASVTIVPAELRTIIF